MAFWKKSFLFFCLSCVLLLSANFVSALEVHYPSLFGHSFNNTDASDPNALGKYICYLFGIGANAALFIALIVVAYGGIYYLVSYGRGKFTNEGKEWVKAGLLGLLIIACASLIIFTINPNLGSCKIGVLSLINLDSFIKNNTPPGAKITVYDEIPIGTLTENLLTRKMDCYIFDENGNPVATTYTDRTTCINQLVEGAHNKARIISSLSTAIADLMSTCSCKDRCDPACGGCFVSNGNTSGTGDECTGSCTGDCMGGNCQQKPNTNDCCPDGVKDKIEHGPINLGDNCNKNVTRAENKTKSNKFFAALSFNPFNLFGSQSSTTSNSDGYKGLDEFRCPNPIPGGHASCNDVVTFVEKKSQVNGRSVTVIDQDNWKKLNLIQQMKYFQEKIKQVKDLFWEDQYNLEMARYSLSACYLAIPYVDLVKTYQVTNQQDNVIITQPFSDPETGEEITDQSTGQPIDSTHYCTGFNYDNSSCFNRCNEVCPASTLPAMLLYSPCGECQSNDFECLKKQESCIEKAYSDRPCIYGSDSSKNFGQCITSCKNSCSDTCKKNYPGQCGSAYNSCLETCSKDSKCVLDNADSCLFGAPAFQKCAAQTTDQGNSNYCINNAYTCKNASDNYSTKTDKNEGSTPGCGDAGFCSEFRTQATCESVNCRWGAAPFNLCWPNAQDPACRGQASSNPNNVDTGYAIESNCPSCSCASGTDCNSYAQNDDSLTFYCKNEWWSDPDREGLSDTPIGKERFCPLSGEVPVGQTVDAAMDWADKISKNMDGLSQAIQNMMDQMIKIGAAKDTSPIQDYCKCNAKLDTDPPNPPTETPICTSGCQYTEKEIPAVTDQNTGEVTTPASRDCSCAVTPCDKNSCQQIITYLAYLSASINSFIATPVESPANVLKQLVYSRKSADKCSLINTAYGAEARLLNCTRVKDEIIPPTNTGKIRIDGQNINGYCYGEKLGNIINKSLTDDWFCCEQYSKNPSTNNNPIYNTK